MNNQLEQNFVRAYTDRPYKHTAMVNHRGTVVAFAADSQRRIYYTTLNLAQEDQDKGDLDVNYWLNDPQPLPFPHEIEQVGYGSLSAVTMPAVKLGGRTEVDPRAVSPSEIDPFLSTTARLSADAPFQVLTDNQYIYVFRQAIAPDHEDTVYKLQTGAASAMPKGAYVTDSAGQKAPLVRGTLLVDRYVLAGATLKLPREARFRRSRNRFRPASAKDSLGAKDMEGNPFYEATKELDFVGALQDGCFAVTLLPTAVADVERWQIFAYNADSKQIDAYNIERDGDGYFNTLGTQLYTSPEEEYQASVLERSPGKCPFTGKALIPVDDPANDAHMQIVSFTLQDRTVSHGLAAQLYYEQENSSELGDPKHVKQHARLLLTAVTAGADPYTGQDRQRDYIAAVDFGISRAGKLAGLPSEIDDLQSATTTLQHEIETLETKVADARAKATDSRQTLQVEIQQLQTDLADYGRPRQVTVYQDRDYGGDKIVFTTGDRVNLKDHPMGLTSWKNQLSSIQVEDGVVVEVFWDDDFSGESKRFETIAYVGNHWNDKVASLIVHEADWLAQKRSEAQNELNDKRQQLINIDAEQAQLEAQMRDKKRQFDADEERLTQLRNRQTQAGLRPAAQGIVPLPALRTDDPDGQTRDQVMGELIALENELPTLEQQVKTIEAQVTAERAKLGTLDNEISQLASTIRQWESEVGGLTDKGEQRNRAKTDWDNLEARYAYFYDKKNHTGHELKRKAGDNISHLSKKPRYDRGVVEKANDALNPFAKADDNWKDSISSIKLDDGVQVEVFWYDDFNSGKMGHFAEKKETFTSSQPSLGDWNNEIASLKVSATQTLVANRNRAKSNYERLKSEYDIWKERQAALPGKHTELKAKQSDRNDVERQLRQAEADLAKNRDTLNRKTARLAELRQMRFDTPPALPMPHCHTDQQGLTIASALLGFAYTDAQPTLFESALGRVKMYFKGIHNQFFAAFYDIRAARAKWSLPTDAGVLTVESMMAANHLNQTTITVADGRDESHCQVTIRNADTGWEEIWPDLPRATAAFAQALNGAANVQQGQNAPLVVYDYARATTNRAGVSLANGSLHIIVDSSSAQGAVGNGTAARITDARSPQWIADATGTALAFDGKAQYISSQRHEKFIHEGDLTLEAWVNPATVANDASIIHARSGADNYALGLRKATLKSALSLKGKSDCVELPSLHSAALNGDFTLEAWVRLGTVDGDQPIIGNLEKSKNKGLHFIVRGSKPYIGFWGNDLSASESLQAGKWYHLACRYNAQNRERALFVNGERVANDTASSNFQGAQIVYIGRYAQGYLHGDIDEARIWNVARSDSDIRANWHRQLGGREPGLLGYYHFANHDAHDRSGHGHHGTLQGNLATSALTDSPLDAYACLAVVGEEAVVSQRAFTAGSWQHFTAVYNQSYALKFSGDAYGDAGNAPLLNITDDLTIEAFIKLDSAGRKQGLLCKGIMDSGAEGSVPYALYINEQGNLVFAFENEEGHNYAYTSKDKIETGQPQRIAVVRKGGQRQSEVKGQKQITYKTPKEGAQPDKDGKVEMVEKTQTIEVVESVSFERYDDIYLYVGSHQTHIHHTEGKPAGNNGQLVIGRSYIGNSQKAQFQGAISEIRIWHKALAEDEVLRGLKGDEAGLTAWWRMEENGGHVAYDAKGNSHARLTGTNWIKNPDPQASSFTLYANGQVIKTQPVSRPAVEADQFTLGARLRRDGGYDTFFYGEIEEVRIWKIARRQEEILDNLFSHLKGEKRDLIAYYTFDHLALDGRTTREEVKDAGLRSNHLSFPVEAAKRPNEVLSTAPISNDTGQVRSALAGVKTDFHETINGRAAVTEYADIQRGPDGAPYGIHKRCYAYTRDGNWLLSTGYKVGNLVTEWIGQAQFDPQVVGYIEGAPPVPSENMTEGNKRTFETFNGASEVTLVESDSVSYTISTSQEDSYMTSFEGEASMGADGEIDIVTAPLGVGVSKKLAFEIQSNLKLGMETSGAWGSGESYSAGQTVTRNSSAALGGSWDAPDQNQWVNPDLTRRFIPANMGFAFVESETADIFALRLEHTGTLVALRMLPNPDIPKDTNIIPFPINNRYTKQGTLDGRLGYTSSGIALDPDYKGATGYGEYSYFKPTEAYALKKRIEREQQKLKAFYDNFDTLPEGARMLKKLQPSIAQVAGAGAIGALVGGVPLLAGMTLAAGLGTTVASAIQYATADKKLAEKYARRNLVNTYVWTADGGFFEESTQVSQVRSTSSSGNYTLSGSATGGFSAGISGVVSFSMGLSGMINGSVNQTRSKNEDAEESFRLDVKLAVPDDLQKYEYNIAGDTDSGVNGVYDKNNPVSHPGKVDAYRFMTFYLEPQSTNFEDLFGKVVDPVWLEQSAHPNALALRQANQSGKKPKCWRVFHRVTFVSRILPDFPVPTAPPLQKKMVDLNIASNYELVRRLDPFVRAQTANWIQFKDAVKQAVGAYLPELAGEEDVEVITEFLADYYGVER